MRRSRIVLPLACAALASGCLFDNAVPDNAIVTCAHDVDCPTGKSCNTASGFCAKKVGSDGVAPGLTHVTINPAAGNVGTLFTVTLTVSEALEATPTVKVSVGPTIKPMAFVPSLSDPSALTFAFQYRAVAGDREGAAPVFVDLLDLSGNAGLGLEAGALIFDKTPPKVTDGSATLTLVPDVDNPLSTVSAATTGTTARVTLTFNEPVRVDTAPVLTSTPSVPWTIAAGGDTNTFTFAHTFSAGEVADGPVSFSVHATDLSGNSGDAAVVLPPPGLSVDFTPPSAPATTTAGTVQYLRAPWGARSSASPFWSVTGSTSDPTAVAVLAYAVTGEELARGDVDAAGTFTAAIPPGDRARIDVAAVDAAGNVSARARVHDVSLVAAVNGKVAGSTFENPNVLEARPALGAAALGVGGTELGDIDHVGTADALTATIEGALTFKRVSPDVTGPGDDSTLGVADTTLHAVSTWNTGSQRQFTWTGLAWRSSVPAQAPSARSRSAVAWDSVASRMMLFGGADHTDEDDLWALSDLDGWQQQTSVDGSTPGPRQQHAMAFDDARDVLVLVTGEGDHTEPQGAPAITWEWDGARWTSVATTDPEGDGDPLSRIEGAMAFHAARGVMVLFGGQGPMGATCETQRTCIGTWIYDGVSWRRDTGPQPPPRVEGALAYNPDRHVVMLYGGRDPANNTTFLGDTWEWDGGWVQITSSPSPSARAQVMLAADPHGGMVLSNGFDAVEDIHEVWRYDSTWHLMSPRGNVPFENAVLAPAPGGAGLLMSASNGNTLLQDTWQRRNGAWSFVTDVGAPIRDNASLVYDPVRDRTILFAGFRFARRNDTWEMDQTGTWAQTFVDQNPPVAQPSRRCGAAAVFDPFLNRPIFIGGIDVGGATLDEAWSYDGTWHVETARPTPRAFSAVAFDAGLNALVLFGGHDDTTGFLADTWLRDATGWHLQSPPTSPPARSSAGLAYVTTLGGTVLVGGNESGDTRDDVWLFRSGTWRQLPTVDRDLDGEPGRTAPWSALTVDTEANQVLLKANSVDQFALEGADERPAAVLHVETRAALAAPGAVTTAVVVRADAGGSSNGPDGALIRVWDGAAWVDLADGTGVPAGAVASVEAPAPAALLPKLVVGSDQRLTVAVTTRGTLGGVGARLNLDALDVVWSYREP